MPQRTSTEPGRARQPVLPDPRPGRLAGADDILLLLTELRNEDNRQGMSRYGIDVRAALGVPVSTLRVLARGVGRDHARALALWESGIHEARLLATMTAVPDLTTTDVMDTWVEEITSWDLCDGACNNLFRNTSVARELPDRWTGRTGLFTRRAGFVMMAVLATHDRRLGDDLCLHWLDIITDSAYDDRPLVRKAVNWALREIRDRGSVLEEAAESLARTLASDEDSTARWIGRDALRSFEKKRSRAKARERG